MKDHLAKLNCAGKCLKYFLGIFNIIIFVFGLAIAGVAGYAAIDKNSELHKLLTAEKIPQLDDGLYVLMAVGIFLAIIAFFGILGALRESRCILMFYLIMLILIFVLQLAGIIVSFVEIKKIEAKIISILKEPPPSDDDSSAEAALKGAVLAAVDAIEKRFHCCGLTGPDNYGTQKLPPSCFAPPPTVASGTSSAAPKEYTEGCVVAFRPYLFAAGGIAIALLLFQILLMLFTCCLMSDIKKGYEKVEE